MGGLTVSLGSLHQREIRHQKSAQGAPRTPSQMTCFHFVFCDKALSTRCRLCTSAAGGLVTGAFCPLIHIVLGISPLGLLVGSFLPKYIRPIHTLNIVFDSAPGKADTFRPFHLLLGKASTF